MIEIVNANAVVTTRYDWVKEYPQILEQYGRTCYKSEAHITDSSAESFVSKIIKSGHESVIEHLVISARVVCDRACSHQLVRHRLASYSQESQRYCDYKGGLVLVLPKQAKAAIGQYDENAVFDDPDTQVWFDTCVQCYRTYVQLRESWPAEDARLVLPNSTKTELICTFNLRQWRHVFKERALNAHAQWQIRGVFLMLLMELNKMLPCVFGDLYKESYN